MDAWSRVRSEKRHWSGVEPRGIPTAATPTLFDIDKRRNETVYRRDARRSETIGENENVGGGRRGDSILGVDGGGGERRGW